MHDPMHRLIAEAAVDWLDGEAAKLWSPERGVMSQASVYPDNFASGEDSPPQCRALEPAWREYTLIPHQNDNKIVHSMYSTQDIRGSYPPVVRHWTAKTLESLKVGKLERAAKFAGCLSHLIGDTGQAAHVFDDRLTNQLFPQGDKRFVIHTAIERVMGRLTRTSYRPRLLAASLDELDWRLVEELERLKRREGAELVQIMGALMSGDHPKAEASASRTVTHCAELFTDLLLTLWALGSGHVADAPQELDMRELVPSRVDSDMLFNFGVMVDRVPGKSLDDSIGLNPGLDKDVPGLALLANMSPFYKDVRETAAEYRLPPGVFRSFECLVGLNHNQENQTDAIFEVKLDGHTVFRSDALGQNGAAVAVKVELGDASTIELHARDVRPAPCRTKFFYPVFATPKLTGRTDAN